MEKQSNPEADSRAFRQLKKLIPDLDAYETNMVMRKIRLRALSGGFPDLESYCRKVSVSPLELEALREDLSYARTCFYRGSVWPVLRQQLALFCRSGRGGGIRVWCAACSSGEEVYSVLMLLLAYYPPHAIALLATDCNRERVCQCREGYYPLENMVDIPHSCWHYLMRSRSGCRFRIRKELRDLVHTGVQDLLSDDYPRSCDLILCRNVIKFFKEELRQQVQKRLSSSLAPGGLLVVFDDLGKERIQAPETLGLSQIGTSPVYRKLPCK